MTTRIGSVEAQTSPLFGQMSRCVNIGSNRRRRRGVMLLWIGATAVAGTACTPRAAGDIPPLFVEVPRAQGDVPTASANTAIAKPASGIGAASAARRAPRDTAEVKAGHAAIAGTDIEIFDLNTAAIDSALRVGKGGAFLIPMYDGSTAIADLQFDYPVAVMGKPTLSSAKTSASYPYSVDIVGSLRGRTSSKVALTLETGALLGTIRFGDTLLQVLPVGPEAGRQGTNRYMLIRQVPQSLPPELPPLRQPETPAKPPGAEKQPSEPQADEAPCTQATVNVLVAFTPKAAGARSDTELATLAEAGVAEANGAFAASQVTHHFVLVGVRRLQGNEIAENGNLNADLEALRSSPTIQSWRRAAGADIVSVWEAPTTMSGATACGLGYVVTNMSTGSPYAFNTVPVDCAVAVGQYSFAHETGHNLGMAHDRETAGSDRGIFDYSYGYKAPNHRFRDLMAYNCAGGCTRELIYSNPRIKIGGVPAGIDYTADPSHSADNAETAQRTACSASRWRKQ